MAISNNPVKLPATKRAQGVVKPLVTETVAPVAARATTTAVAPVAKIGLKERVLTPILRTLHGILEGSPGLNKALGRITGPIVKHGFNPPPGSYTPPAPEPLKPQTIEQARQVMANAFKPAQGKAVIAISGGGPESVHCFVVSGVKSDGTVMITQALAQATGPKEDYSGIGGHIQKWMDKLLHNSDQRMAGVVEESWAEYAPRSHRNSIVVMQVDADPKKLQETLAQLKTFVGRPYDHTMLAAAHGTPASTAEMFCTEVSSWFVNELHPGTIQQSQKLGYPLYQVADHMKATDLRGGPLKVLFNGENRLDVANANPVDKWTDAATEQQLAAVGNKLAGAKTRITEESLAAKSETALRDALSHVHRI